MSFIGTGGEDWIDLDLEGFELDRRADITAVLASKHDDLVDVIGAEFEIEATSSGTADLLVDGRRRFSAAINAEGRLVLTAAPDPEGPL